MGRKKQVGAGYNIYRAEELFRQSEADGKPDYKYVALAIGAAPAAPPSWAVLACIELRQEEEGQAARGHPTKVSAVLDDLVRFFDQKQREFERQSQDSPEIRLAYSPPSFRSALRQVLASDEGWKHEIDGANDDWQKPFRNAWRWEQENDLAPSSFWQLDGFNTTSRIDRVMTQSVAAELGDPEDMHVWAWTTKRIAERNRP